MGDKLQDSKLKAESVKGSTDEKYVFFLAP